MSGRIPDEDSVKYLLIELMTRLVVNGAGPYSFDMTMGTFAKLCIEREEDGDSLAYERRFLGVPIELTDE